jgi:hypothetical protein
MTTNFTDPINISVNGTEILLKGFAKSSSTKKIINVKQDIIFFKAKLLENQEVINFKNNH